MFFDHCIGRCFFVVTQVTAYVLFSHCIGCFLLMRVTAHYLFILDNKKKQKQSSAIISLHPALKDSNNCTMAGKPPSSICSNLPFSPSPAGHLAQSIALFYEDGDENKNSIECEQDY